MVMRRTPLRGLIERFSAKLEKLIHPRRPRNGRMIKRDRILVNCLNVLLWTKRLPLLRNYIYCPRCKTTSVEWHPSHQRYRCLVTACRWREEEESLPLHNYATGRLLYPGEIIEMVQRKIHESRR
jgi:hypothetical protein